jgi:ABC-type antimicrobial peptide transport system permease subunit
VSALVMLEAALMMVVGGVLGLAVAWGVVRYLSGQLGYMAVSGGQLALGVALMLVTAMIAGFTPALRASRLDIVDALRSVRR